MSWKTPKYTVIQPEQFKDRFDVDSLLSSLSKDTAKGAKGGKPVVTEGPAIIATTKSSLERVALIIKNLDRASEEIESLKAETSSKVVQLQSQVGQEESEYKGAVRALERAIDQTRENFKGLDACIGRVTSTATRIGDRLQTSETLRSRALETVDMLYYLQCFSTLPDEDFSRLPRLFTDDAKFAQAAAVARKLVALATEALVAKQRTKMTNDAGPQSPHTHAADRYKGPGSVEYTIKMLEAYCNWLENRVVSWFDRAAAERNLAVMAEVVRIMAEFDRERTIIQRYVASRPMFLDLSDEVAGAAGGKEGGKGKGQIFDVAAQMKPLHSLFSDLLAAVKDEVAQVMRIFAQPKLALELFLQRIFEQKVHFALERLLQQPAANASAVVQQNYLQLLAEAYEATVALADDMDKACKGSIDLSSMADNLFTAFLADYPSEELAWMEQKYCEEIDKFDTPELSLAFAQQLMDNNREACQRCLKLCQEAAVPRSIRVLFHSSSFNAAHTGCLLEQLARHIIWGVEYSLELCSVSSRLAGLSGFSLAFSVVNRQTSVQLAEQFINDRIRRVLDATRVATEIVLLLQQYYAEVILPVVSCSVPEHASANSGLAALLRAVEDTTLAVLRKCVDTFFAQVDKVLYAEQRKADFLPRDTSAVAFDKPTNACLMVTAMLASLRSAACDSLAGANLASFLAEVGTRMHQVLDDHMAKYVYSPMGALRWKSDVAEYSEALRAYGVHQVNERMGSLQAVVNVLVVAPESLLGLVNGGLRLDHREALRYIALREDFKSARVEGQTLQQLFSAEGDMDAMPNFRK